MTKIRVGIIGVGGFGRGYHLTNLLRCEAAQIVGICDISEQSLARLKGRINNCPTYYDYRELLNQGELDAVIVSTPNYLHYEQCQMALQKGIHVLVDKPMTMNSKHAKELVELSQSTELILMTAFTRHSLPSCRYVREQIRSGATGNLNYIVSIQRPLRTDGGLDANGGFLWRRGVHIADLSAWLTDQKIVEVRANIEYDTQGFERWVSVAMTLSSGLASELIEIQTAECYQDEVTVYGTHQSYRIYDREKLFQSVGRQGWHALDELPKYPNTTDVFIKAVCGYPSTLSTCEECLHAEDGLAATRVIEAAIESAKLGKPVVVQ
ncbi:Gfo/Idh/MocA family oxidoreductase [bacterium]|nr:Gfo/Idh/MocA family oxidoreductase [bacterium]